MHSSHCNIIYVKCLLSRERGVDCEVSSFIE
jgi:hypothetical protein